MGTSDRLGIDDTDQEILDILRDDPRMPYTEIVRRLAERDIELSAEAVRQRVNALFEESAVLLLSGPASHDWEVLRVDVTTCGGTDWTDEIFDWMAANGFWLVCRGLGPIDVHGVATVPDVAGANQLIDALRDQDGVEQVAYFIETDRRTAMHEYMVRPDETS